MSQEKPAEADWLRQQERSNLAILKLMVWISLTFGRAIGRLVLVGIAVWAFFWAANDGQFDDLETPALAPLLEDAQETPE